MKTRDQRSGRSSRAGAQAPGLERESGGQDAIHKENDPDERRVTRSMKKGGERRVVSDHSSSEQSLAAATAAATTKTEATAAAEAATETTRTDSVSDQPQVLLENGSLDAKESMGSSLQENKNTTLRITQEASQTATRRRHKKVLRKSRRGRIKKRTGQGPDTVSAGGGVPKYQGFESRGGNDVYSVNELEMDITSVTFINESSACTASPAGGGGASRMAKISWSRFDSFFRKIPMGAKKEVILKTIPTSPGLRKPIIQELTTLEQTLFTDPPWGKIGKVGPYVSKASLSLPPIYMKSCSLDAIVDLVSRSILKSRGGNPPKMPLEIQKPYFVLFELPSSLSLVALESKSLQELGMPSESGLEVPEARPVSEEEAPPPEVQEIPDDGFNVKWDILQTLSLSYYQFKYMERYLHDVFFNYDQSHKKVFFTPARINDRQDLFTINVLDWMRSNLDELNSLIGLHVSDLTRDPQEQDLEPQHPNGETPCQEKPLDLGSLVDEFHKSHTLAGPAVFESAKSSLQSRDPSSETFQDMGGAAGASQSQPSHIPLYRNDLWGTYRSYDPIYWWIDFVLSSGGPDTGTDSQQTSSSDHQKVLLHNNGLSYIDAPECVEVGGLYWLNPSEPIRLTREVRDTESGETEAGTEDPGSTCNTLCIHPYMMNDFVDHRDFNFVEANLERFLPIYNEIVDSIAKLRFKIQSRIIHENENNIRITDIPSVWMNVVQRYQITNSWNKLKFFLTSGYKDLYPAFLRQIDASKKTTEESSQDSGTESRFREEKRAKSSKVDVVLLESKEKNVHLTNVCTVCFNWETDTLKPFVECVRCGVVSHVACYGVNIPLNELLDFYGWLCDRCEFEKKSLGTQYLVSFSPGSVSCVLCSHSGGAMKRTNREGEWVHLVCAIWHLPLVSCEDWKNLSGWNVDRLKRSWTNKKIGLDNNPDKVLAAGRSRSPGSGPPEEETKKDGPGPEHSPKEEPVSSGGCGTGPSPGRESGGPDSVRCVFCRNDNTFGLVGCDQKDCMQLFHPICAWLNGVQVEVDRDPNYSKGETLIGLIQGWRSLQDETLQLVNFRCFCTSHARRKEADAGDRNLAEEVNLRRKRYVNRDMFPDLFDSKYNQKSSRTSQIGVIQRSRTRSISRSKSWDVGAPSTAKKSSSCEIFKQNQIYYYSALNPDKYDRDVCCICLKQDSTDFPSGAEESVMQVPRSAESTGSGSREGTPLFASNILVRCLCCGLVVHWSCYGLDGNMRSLDDFVCQTCARGVRPEGAACILCPRRGGALIEAQGIPQSFFGRTGDKAQFLHVTCALYTPGVYILSGGQAYGAANYLGMTSLVRLQKDASSGKSKGGVFVRKFGGVEGSVQQLPFRDIRNEEQFILDQLSEQDALEIPSVYCCICKSSYGVNLACNHPGCTRTAHPLCMKLYGCHMETVAEIEEPDQGQEDALPEGGSFSRGESPGVLYVSASCQPPVVDAATLRHPCQRENYFSQRVFCPEHGKQLSKLNPGGRLLHSTLSSMKIVSKIMEDLRHSEKLKRQLFSTQLDIMSREAPIFSPFMMGNASALQIYWNYHSRGILQESVKIRNGTISKFKDNLKNGLALRPPLAGRGDSSLLFGGSKSPRKSQLGSGALANPTAPPCQGAAVCVSSKSTGLKRTRSSGEAVEVPSLEDAIREARRQREIYKKELVASGVVLKKRPPPNRGPTVPFSRLTDDELKKNALKCLKVTGSSSKLAMSLMTGYENPNTEAGNVPTNVDHQTPSSLAANGPPNVRSFCIKQHRHDCFRRRLAEFILQPPAVMDHRRKTLRSLTRQLKQYGVTAEELMASDVPLPPIKSKPPTHFPPAQQGIVSTSSHSHLGPASARIPENTSNATSTATITNTTNSNTTAKNLNPSINNDCLQPTAPAAPPSSSTTANTGFGALDYVNTNFISPDTGTPEPPLDQARTLQPRGPPQSQHSLYF